jgi:hypothetical protein
MMGQDGYWLVAWIMLNREWIMFGRGWMMSDRYASDVRNVSARRAYWPRMAWSAIAIALSLAAIMVLAVNGAMHLP